MIENHEKPIGYALLSFTYSNEAGGMGILIEEVQIDSAYRGGGYGSKLFSFLEQEYPTVKRFRLEVDVNNIKAIDLYIRLGYKIFDYVQMVKEVSCDLFCSKLALLDGKRGSFLGKITFFKIRELE